ncbi:MAG: type II toxin-antitoxin system VapC family toxin [Anaerolineales bacterium]|nr:type II toxin-antitoxin system VapC family toxin [Anaerolineales bacterium]
MNNLTLVDTDILIDVGRNELEALEFIDRLHTQSTLAISLITQMELIVGCRSKRELVSLEKFLSRFELISLNEEMSIIGVELLREYRLSHGLLIADALIAATAIHLDLPFISKNQKDYRFITTLNLIQYP